MASDGFLPARLSEIDDNGVPRLALFVTVSASAITALFVDFETLADLVSVASLVSLSVVCVCSILVRVKPVCWVDEVALVEPEATRTNTPPPIIESEMDENINNFYPSQSRDIKRFETFLGIYVVLGALTSAALLHSAPLYVGLSLAIIQCLCLATVCSQYMILPKEVDVSSINQSGTFRVPFSPLLPLLGVFINTYLLIGLPSLALIRAAAVFASCGAYYCVFLRSFSQNDSESSLKAVKHQQMKSYDSVS
jgi:cationic amino acid transporter 1